MTMNEATYFARLRELQSAAWPAGVARQPHYPLGEIAISEHLREWARRQPDKPACIFYGREISYGELNDLSERFAALLHEHGVQPGDRVAVFLPNSPQFMLAFFAILKLGAVHVPVNPLFREAELAYELNDTGARIIICLDSLMPLLRQVRDQTPVETVFVTSFAEMLPDVPSMPVPPALLQPRIACDDAIDLLPALAQVTAPAPAVQPDLDAVAALNYTGGTTGMPKGCIHTQRDMLYTAGTGLAASFALSPDDVVVNFVPIFWIAGEDTGLLFPLVAGATVVLMARWDAVGFMTAVERYKASFAYLLVDNTVEVLEHPQATAFDLSSLRKVRVSSFVKKLNPDFRARWRALTGADMIEAAWGMTETHTMDTFTIGMQRRGFRPAVAAGLRRAARARHRFQDLRFRQRRPDAAGRDRRDLRADALAVQGLLEQARGDGGSDPERLPPHRRHRCDRRAGLSALPRTPQGDAEGQGDERVPGRDRGHARPASRHRGIGRHRARGQRARTGSRRLHRAGAEDAPGSTRLRSPPGAASAWRPTRCRKSGSSPPCR